MQLMQRLRKINKSTIFPFTRSSGFRSRRPA